MIAHLGPDLLGDQLQQLVLQVLLLDSAHLLQALHVQGGLLVLIGQSLNLLAELLLHLQNNTLAFLISLLKEIFVLFVFFF